MKARASIIILVLMCGLTAHLWAEADYAEHLFRKSSYPAAILEYERYLYYQAANASDSLYALRGIVKAYYQAGLYDEMVGQTRQSALQKNDPEFTVRFISLSELRRGRYEVASLLPNTDSGPKALLLRGIAELYLDRRGEAKTHFEALPEYDPRLFPIDKRELIGHSENLHGLAHRSAWLAGTLALIPGAGYAYNGKWQTAISSLLLHAAIFASAWELRQNQLPISSAVVALIGTAYYLGNIYGSVSEALKFNRLSRENYLDSSLAPYFEYLEE